jgi:cytochrome d ubiquinol oxidase subunit I
VGLAVGLAASLLQLVTGHESAAGLSQHQPIKLAAFEGHYTTTNRAPLYLFGWVDDGTERVKGGLAIPGLLSRLIHGDTETPVPGLRDLAPDPRDRPPVNVVFQLYHGMVAVGMALIALSLLGAFAWWRGWLFECRWLLWLLVFSVLGPQLANQLGWFAAEIGRQPWIVYGRLRTDQAFSAVLRAETVLTSLVVFAVIYTLLFAVFVYVLNDKIQHGPDDADLAPTGKLALGFGAGAAAPPGGAP